MALLRYLIIYHVYAFLFIQPIVLILQVSFRKKFEIQILTMAHVVENDISMWARYIADMWARYIADAKYFLKDIIIHVQVPIPWILNGRGSVTRQLCKSLTATVAGYFTIMLPNRKSVPLVCHEIKKKPTGENTVRREDAGAPYSKQVV